MENNLPKGWVECSLGEILTAKKGKKPSSVIGEPRTGYVPYILIDEMEGKPIRNYTNDPKVSIIDETEVLLVWDGSIGKCGSGMKGAIGSTLVGLKALGGIETKFLEYTIKQQNNFIKETSTGTGLQHINKDFFEICKIPLPPLAEQNRIVAKLDAIMQKVESNKQRLEKIPNILKRFRQSVLSAAISGKLTEEWRKENEFVEKINMIELQNERERLQKENAKRKGQKTFTYKQSVAIEIGGRTKGVDELYELPENWNWVSLDSCVWSVSDGPHFSPKYVEKEEGVAFISSRNVSYNKIDFSDAKYVSKADHKEFIKRGKPENDDILLTKGGTTGIAHKINTEIEFSIWVHVALLKVIKKYIDSNYLRDALTSDFLYRQSQAQTHGVGNQDLGLTRMIFMTIPLPPLDEQKEIVKRVEQLFAFADKIESRYTKAKSMLDKLHQSILAKAFRGELVAQDPNDEPASVLLEKIKAEKEQLKAEKKRKKSSKEKVIKKKKYRDILSYLIAVNKPVTQAEIFDAVPMEASEFLLQLNQLINQKLIFKEVINSQQHIRLLK